jgi:hypothetical protein
MPGENTLKQAGQLSSITGSKAASAYDRVIISRT